MPRRQFQADLAKAMSGVQVAGVSDVEAGGDDGEFAFTCVADGQKLKIFVMIPGTRFNLYGSGLADF